MNTNQKTIVFIDFYALTKLKQHNILIKNLEAEIKSFFLKQGFKEVIAIFNASFFNKELNFSKKNEAVLFSTNPLQDSISFLQNSNYTNMLYIEDFTFMSYDYSILLNNPHIGSKVGFSYSPEKHKDIIFIDKNGFLTTKKDEYFDCFINTKTFLIAKTEVSKFNFSEPFKSMSETLKQIKFQAIPLAGLSSTLDQVIPNLKKTSLMHKDLKPCLFLDRDGVLIEDKHYPYKISELKPISEFLPILEFAKSKNWHIIVISNQSGLARGKFSDKEFSNAIDYLDNYFKNKKLTIDKWLHCPYLLEGSVTNYKKDSLLRKPWPGMVLQSLQDFAIDLKQSFMIGDKDSDQLDLVNLKTFLIKGEYEIKKKELSSSSFKKILEQLKKLDI